MFLSLGRAPLFFWNDVWCGELLLKVRFQRVYVLDLEKSCSVAHIIRLSNWFSILRRPPRGGDEFDYFTSLIFC